MKTRVKVMVVVCLGIATFGCAGNGGSGAGAGKPDLVIDSFKTLSLGGTSGGHVKVPVLVVVKNQGGTLAGKFKVSIEFKKPSGKYYVCDFSPSGQTGAWYYWVNSLASGKKKNLNGDLFFGDFEDLRHVTVTLRARVDSCLGDEHFVPPIIPDCRVIESDEANNDDTTEFYVP